METVSPAPEESLNANPSSVKSDDSSPRPENGRGSPPPKCAICLGTCKNKSFTDSCLHQFCFTCLLTWSKVKAECPLCKQVFKSIIHNVRSNHQYEEYMVEQRQTTEIINFENLLSNAPRRFRYRTTLTLPVSDRLVFEQFLQQRQLNPSVISTRSQRSPSSFRRTVYRHNLWARPLPDFTGRFRDCTPEFYRYNDAQMHRLVPWLNRELHYLLNENAPHVTYVLSRILELLRQLPINSQEFRNAVYCYFGDRTEHFLHELYCFASTPYDMTGYDRHVQYSTDPRVSTMVNEVLSSSDSDGSVDSDIVMVTSSAPAVTAGPSRPPIYPPHYLPAPVIPIETISHSDTDDDDVLVVGYIKPPEQRTPEVVDLLGSDSDVVVQDTPQPTTSTAAAAPVAETPSAPTTPLVKIRLKRTGPPQSPDSDSDTRVYIHRRGCPARRRRRLRSQRSSSNDSWQPQLQFPLASSSSSPSSTTSPSPSTTSMSSDESTASYSTDTSDTAHRTYEPKKRRNTTKKIKKTSSKPLLPLNKDKTRTSKKTESNRTHRNKDSGRKKDKKSKTSNPSTARRKDKKLKRKSRSKKDVKSSKKSKSSNKEVTPLTELPPPVEATPTPTEEIATDQPSTSGTQISPNNTPIDTNSTQINKRDDSRERKRLKSVVKVKNWSAPPPNLINIVSSAILAPKSDILTYNSDSGSQTNEVVLNKPPKKKTRDRIEKAQSRSNWSNCTDCDSDSDYKRLNLSMDSS